MKRQVSKNRKGMTMIEVLVGTSISFMALTALISVSLFSTAVASKLSGGIKTFSQARRGIERASDEVQMADMVMARYPTTGAATFTTNTTDTIILRKPVVSGMDFAAGQYEIVIFNLDGDQKLSRYTATISGGTQSAPALDRVIATDVSSLSFTYSAHETFLGQSYYAKYKLRSHAVGSAADNDESVLIDGVDKIADGSASIVSDELRLGAKLNWNQWADAIYNTDPSEIVFETAGINANFVTMKLVAAPKWKDRTGSEQTRTIEFNSRLRLRNRS